MDAHRILDGLRFLTAISRRMADATCNQTYILPSHTSQVAPSQRTAIFKAALVYADQKQSGRTQFKSSGDYLQYKKAQAMAIGTTGGRPVQTAVITDLQIVSECGLN
jgi:hypothetical protein